MDYRNQIQDHAMGGPGMAIGREEALIGGTNSTNAVRSALVDVSTQVDLPQEASGSGGGGLFSCGGEDEEGGRRRGLPLGKGSKKAEVPVYSKEDIREQYCITQRQLNVLERGPRGLFGGGGGGGGVAGGPFGGGGGGLFGCLSNYQESTCHRSSLLSVCLRGEEPNEEYVQETGVFRRKRRGVGDGWGNGASRDLAPAPRWRYPHHERFYGAPGPPAGPPEADGYRMGRRPRSFCAAADPKRFTWLSEDEEATPRMERPRPIRAVVEEEPGYMGSRGYDTEDAMTYSTDDEALERRKRFTGDPGEEEDDEEEEWYTGRGRRRLYLRQSLSQSSEYIGECPAHPNAGSYYPLPPPPPPPAKHVSFDARSLVRSQTVTSFEGSTTSSGGVQSSRERLIDGRKETVAVSPVLAKAIFMEKMKRATMKTQATQTDMWKAAFAAVVADGRFTVPRRHPPHHHRYQPQQHQSALSLSPRTVHRVEMVSQGAQTNGMPRRLTKSLSEAGQFPQPAPRHTSSATQQQIAQPQTPPPPPSPHEPLHRAASEGEGVEGRKRLGSGSREILIDFEPQQGVGGRLGRTSLHKTMSEGEVRRQGLDPTTDTEASYSPPRPTPQPRSSYTSASAPCGLASGGTFPRMQGRPTCSHPALADSVSSGRQRSPHHPLVQAPSDADSIVTIEEDEFHENLVVSGFFRKRSLSLEDAGAAVEGAEVGGRSAGGGVFVSGTASIASSVGGSEPELRAVVHDEEEAESKSREKRSGSQGKEQLQLLEPSKKSSPFASMDSLTGDGRDHSDSIWNESQATVLQANIPTSASGTVGLTSPSGPGGVIGGGPGGATGGPLTLSDSESGTLASVCSELSAGGPGGTASTPSASNNAASTPSARRRQMLILQHQQRSSVDTEALEDEGIAAEVPTASGKESDLDASPVTVPEAPLPSGDQVCPDRRKQEEGIAVVPASPEPEMSRGRVTTSPPPRPTRARVARRRGKARRMAMQSSEDEEEGAAKTEESAGAEEAEGVAVVPVSVPCPKDEAKEDREKDVDKSETSEDYVTATESSGGVCVVASAATGVTGGKGVGTAGGSSGGGAATTAGDGSSFESASSMYSLVRGEAFSEDSIQLSVSPPAIAEEEAASPREEESRPPAPEAPRSRPQAPRPPPSPPPAAQKPLTATVGTQACVGGTSSPEHSGDRSSSSGSYSLEEGSSGEEGRELVRRGAERRRRRRRRVGTRSGEEEEDYDDEEEEGKEEVEGGVFRVGGRRWRSGEGGLLAPPPSDAARVPRKEALDEDPGGSGWSEEERRLAKKGMRLEFPGQAEEDVEGADGGEEEEGESRRHRSHGYRKKSSKSTRRDESEVRRPGRAVEVVLPSSRRPKPPRTSLMVKTTTARKVRADDAAAGMVRSPAMPDGFRDGESTEDEEGDEGRRRRRPMRESPRRRSSGGSGGGSGGRSPGSSSSLQRPRRRSSGAEEKGAIGRRRSAAAIRSPADDEGQPRVLVSGGSIDPGRSPTGESPTGTAPDQSSSHLSPHRFCKSPGGSPRRKGHRSSPQKGSPRQQEGTKASSSIVSPESSRLMALSAESLRSVSPGSDSVFYADGADEDEAMELGADDATEEKGHQPLCRHCGEAVSPPRRRHGEKPKRKEESPPPPPRGLSSSDPAVDELLASGDIVLPPAGFADSPDVEGQSRTTPGTASTLSPSYSYPGAIAPPASTSRSAPAPAAAAPASSARTGRLYKKLDKRFRSEERRRHRPKGGDWGWRGSGGGGGAADRSAPRAKSEERDGGAGGGGASRRGEEGTRSRMRRSQSSQSVGAAICGSGRDAGEGEEGGAEGLEGSREALEASKGEEGLITEDSTVGVSTECYRAAPWIYIGDSEELRVWQRRVVADISAASGRYRHQSVSSQKSKGDAADEGADEDVDEDEDEDEDEEDGEEGEGEGDDGGKKQVSRRAKKKRKRRGRGREGEDEGDESPTGSLESTNSERDFRRKYQAITHRMVHRKSSVEMYRRLASKSFAKEPEEWSLRKSAQQLLRKMLLVWCRETVAIGLLPHRGGESDKRVVVRRERGGEFGFRIHGSRPVVVSAIEAGTPAESSGLEVGDIVLSVNGAPVLDASHSEVVKIAHAGSDTLELEVARTCDVLTPVLRTAGLEGLETEWSDLEGVADMLLAGYLWKMATNGSGVGRWHRRWFTLRRNHCLYYYKSEEEVQPLGALALAGYSVEILESKKGIGEDAGEENGWEPSYAFRVWRRGALGLTLGTETVESGNQWSRALAKAIERSSQGDAWLEQVERWVGLGPGAITRPDCFGYLSYLVPSEGAERSASVGGTGRRRGKSGGSVGGTGDWRRRYCVLKDACLFFYEDVDSRSAVGMACLHGYRVQSSSPAAGPPGAGKRLFAFEVLPPLAPSPTSDHHHHHHHHHGGHHRHHTTGQRHALPYHQKHFHFHTDTEMDKKRWLAALEYSIDRWIKVG